MVYSDSVASLAKTLTGWAVGAGLEYAIASNWSLKGEYLHYDMGSITYGTTPLASTAGFPFPGNVTVLNFASTANFKGDIVRAGINYKFGGPVVATY
jgi:outer membrane immunogenic protein